MRVLHVLNGVSGGAARSVAELAQGLTELGITSAAVCHTPPDAVQAERSVVEEAFAGQIRYLPLYRWNRRLRAQTARRPLITVHQLAVTGLGYGSARRVVEVARHFGPDVIHTNTFTTPDGAVAARALGLPHVWHVRELIGPGEPFRYHGGASGFRRLLAGSRFIVNSPATAAGLATLMPDVEPDLVPNGLALDPLTAVARDRRRPGPGPGPGPTVVAMVANLTSTMKRHRLFIEAAARCGRVPDLRFRIYGLDPSVTGGDGPARRHADQLHRLVSDLGLDDRFEFAGYRSDPARIMAEVDILVVPNETETFGRTAVEAMAAGACVVAVDVAALRFVLDQGRAGVLVPVGDAAAVAEAVTRLAGDPARQAELADLGQVRAQAFSLDRACQQVVEVYRQARAAPDTPESLARSWAGLIPLRAAGVPPRRST